ncbi:MAG: hypothetical protein GY804_14370 [Alphaproteobacteria bacterium]|nr:hypothetical protein [Alphaproteobacteria bacterium]
MGNLSLEAFSTKELVKIALKNIDSNDAALAIAIIQQRGTIEEFETARKLAKSIGVKTRQLAIRILGQLNCSDRSMKNETVDILIHILTTAKENEVLADACVALGYRQDRNAIAYLHDFMHHPDPNVRYGVAFGVMGHEDNLAIETLVALSCDENLKVRDWATYGLSKKIKANTPPIRDALFANVYDDDLRVRGEALVGLARRNDLRVVEPLIEEISHKFPGYLALEAISILKDPSFYSALMALNERTSEFANIYYQEKLEKAIEACTNNRNINIENTVRLPKEAKTLPTDVQNDYHELFIPVTSLDELEKESASITEKEERHDNIEVFSIEDHKKVLHIPLASDDIKFQQPNKHTSNNAPNTEEQTNWKYFEQRDITAHGNGAKVPPEISASIKENNHNIVATNNKKIFCTRRDVATEPHHKDKEYRDSSSFCADKNKKLNNANENAGRKNGQGTGKITDLDSSWLKQPTYRCTIVKPFFIPTSPTKRPNA